jgi:hypothetical protein
MTLSVEHSSRYRWSTLPGIGGALFQVSVEHSSRYRWSTLPGIGGALFQVSVVWIVASSSFVFFAKKHRRFILCFRGTLGLFGLLNPLFLE